MANVFVRIQHRADEQCLSVGILEECDIIVNPIDKWDLQGEVRYRSVSKTSKGEAPVLPGRQGPGLEGGTRCKIYTEYIYPLSILCLRSYSRNLVPQGGLWTAEEERLFDFKRAARVWNSHGCH